MTETKTNLNDVLSELTKLYGEFEKAKDMNAPKSVNSTNPTTPVTPTAQDQKESVKLVKNTKGYNWEIKLRDDEITGETLERLQAIDKNLQYKFTQK